MKTIFFLLLFFSVTQALTAQEITGDWYGKLDVQNTKLTLVFHINGKDGVYQSTFDNPDQGARGIPTAYTTFKDSLLEISIPSIKAIYKGRYSEGKLQGTFTQAGYLLPLELSRKEIIRERPQEPRKPYPYHTEEVSFINKEAGITLAGTLTLPEENGTYPAVVLISGSGPQNRDEELCGHKPFLVLADYLTRQGIAVLRFDDRGTGASTGDFNSSTAENFATDITAGIDYLKTRKEIRPSAIGLIGHSEGGMIAPMVAAGNTDVAFIVLLAAPGVPCFELWKKQIMDLNLAGGASQEQARNNMEISEKAAQISLANSGLTARTELEKYYKSILPLLTRNQKMTEEQEQQFINGQTTTITQPWFRYFLNYDPMPNLEKTRCPVLALNGEKDLQVNAAQNLEGIRKALTKAGNKSFKIIALPGLNHLFQECTTGLPSEYIEITQTFSPAVLQQIADWIARQTPK